MVAHHDLARVQPNACREAQPLCAAQFIGVAPDLIAQMQGGPAGALRVVLVRDRRTEQRHDAVAGELVDEALEAFDTVGQDAKEALHDLRESFRIELLGQLHRALHVGEEDGDLLALAPSTGLRAGFEGGLRLQDLVGEMFGRVGKGVGP